MNIGVLYVEGWGVAQDYAAAQSYFRQALALGAPGAGYNLGHMYQQGEGVAADAREAAKWYRRGAELGDGRAQLNLAVLTGDGVIGPPDLVQAYVWFSLAAERFEDGKNKENAIGGRDQCASLITPEQRTEAERRLRAWRASGGSRGEVARNAPEAIVDQVLLELRKC